MTYETEVEFDDREFSLLLRNAQFNVEPGWTDGAGRDFMPSATFRKGWIGDLEIDRAFLCKCFGEEIVKRTEESASEEYYDNHGAGA